jgi:uncharacterized protein YjbI with pentapeptide repeats
LTRLEPPEPPEFEEPEEADLPAGDAVGELRLSGVVVSGAGRDPLATNSARVEESELRAVTLAGGELSAFALRDVILRNCDLSNVHSRQGSMRRVQMHGSRLLGFALTEARVADLGVLDSGMSYASLARSRLERVVFERVNLREASFMETQLRSVAFIDCDLAGADFRGAKLEVVTMRGTTLEGVIGVESLAGLTIAWPDLVASAAALAAALGITAEVEQ